MSPDNDVTPPERPPRPRRESGRLQQLRESDGYRRFMDKGVWPLMTLLAMGAIARVQHGYTVATTEKKVDDKAAEVSAEVEKKAAAAEKAAKDTTKRAWRGLADPTNKLQERVQSCEARLTQVEATQAAQSAVVASWQHDFIVEGRPSSATLRVDAGLVKTVRKNAAKNSRELEARRAKPLPALKPLPLDLPPAPPKVDHLAPAPAKIDHPTPAPVPPAQPQIRDADLAKQ